VEGRESARRKSLWSEVEVEVEVEAKAEAPSLRGARRPPGHDEGAGPEADP
jgi:hypothetical protein